MSGRDGDVLVLGEDGTTALTKDAALWFAALAKSARDALRNGGRNDPDVERWTAAALDAAARNRRWRTSDIGRSDVPIEAEFADVPMLDPVGSNEAATILRRTTREFTRLCKDEVLTTAKRRHGRWFAERSELELRSAGRTT